MHTQTYINNPDVLEVYNNIQQEYLENGITETKFTKIDSILVKYMDYPDVGYWRRTGSYHVIYIHPSVLTDPNPYALEYVLKHELGHAHGLKHNTDILSIMCEYHEPPLTEDGWFLMNYMYYSMLMLKPAIASVE